MGTTHIFYLYDDALAAARDDPASRDLLALELGRAILGLTVDPEYLAIGGGAPGRVTWQRVGAHANALQWCDEVHDRDVRVYVWAGNCLRELGAIDDDVKREAAAVMKRTLESTATRR